MKIPNKKLNFAQKFLLKLNRPADYMYYKQMRKFLTSKEFNQKYLSVVSPPKVADTVSFKHSGNVGDIIYALPSIIALSMHKPSHLYLHLNQKGCSKDHPLGGVMLNEKIAEMIKPLLEAQPYINSVGIYDGQQPVTYNLDLFRELPVSSCLGDISRWYFQIFDTNYDLSRAWIQAIPNNNYKDTIVWARSERYQNPHLDFSFLAQYPKIVFVGLDHEYQLAKKQVPNIEHVKVKDFLELAQLIAGAKLFIGNQSFPYALAEAMKVPRILELCYYTPNVVIHGENGYDTYFQANLEKRISALYEK
ncbi:hypothetical protein SAMN05421780_10886 [Flexibacter flexilis DSM 6793]|uniref:Glycosyltransferase family 9 (Heptosyltransferase) n=1 Tax=Flexibacter flexilis DSM 6793 TaxID=927664 RepID=A0A1I1L6H5_9BACT|nr:hypothetical protein [Flexibacter flexilis]SFC68626.1 hypothetical protein SAMN05421780_10886 [Flexibacter flexilis DSM 6793]